MLKHQPWMKSSYDLKIELLQSSEEGKDIKPYEAEAEQILAMDREDPEREARAVRLYEALQNADIIEGYKYIEPNEYESIMECRPFSPAEPAVRLSEDELYDRIYGGWLGRCAGCLLGQPIEGWHRSRITGLLKETGNYPVNYYISSDIREELRSKYNVRDDGHVYGSEKINWINNISYMPEDDDTNYTAIGLKIVETYGREFTSDNVAEAWLTNLPIFHTCTAERVAYKNLVNLIVPPKSASYANPYREWIGAQIRADLFGYINPYSPEKAARMAYNDAAISHTKNGIYGEMFMAAMISAAFTTKNMEQIIKTGLSQIPKQSRLNEKIMDVIAWYKSGKTYTEVLDLIHSIYDEKNSHDWCHTISNAMIVCTALLYGECSLEKTIGIAVEAGFDTDCNGASSGSIVGVACGAGMLPDKWIKPLNDRLKSGVDGFGMVAISDVARRTLAVSEK